MKHIISPYTAVVTGSGFFVPGYPVSNNDLPSFLDTSDEWITQRTGIKQRYLAPAEALNADLAVIASTRALKQSRLSASDIDLIIVATSTSDYAFPSTAMLVRQALGSNAPAFDLSAACTGFIYALSVGSQFIKAGTYEHILIIGSEKMSSLIDWQDRRTAVLFGDGAGAVVLQKQSSAYPAFFRLESELGEPEILQAPAKGPITMQGSEIFKFGVRTLMQAIQETLQQLNLQLHDISLIIPHQANIRMIRNTSERLGIPMDKFYVNIQQYGNTSAASIPIALAEAVDHKRLHPGDLVLMVGFGAGLSWGVTVMQISYNALPSIHASKASDFASACN